MNINSLRGSFNYAMHGCGAYRGILHSNSKEAYNHWKKKVNIFEVDVVETADGDFILFASHGISDNELYRLEVYNPSPIEDRTSDYLLGQKLFSRSSSGVYSLSLPVALEEMKRNPSLIFIFDLFGLWKSTPRFVKRLICVVEKEIHLFERIVLEAYYETQIRDIQSIYSAINIMYCVKELSLPYPSDLTYERLIQLGVSIISYPWKNINDYNELKRYVEGGFLVMSLSHTNLGARKKKKIGVNINNVDIIFSKKDFLKEFTNYAIGRIRWYSVKVYDRYIINYLKNEKNINCRRV